MSHPYSVRTTEHSYTFRRMASAVFITMNASACAAPVRIMLRTQKGLGYFRVVERRDLGDVFTDHRAFCLDRAGDVDHCVRQIESAKLVNVNPEKYLLAALHAALRGELRLPSDYAMQLQSAASS